MICNNVFLVGVNPKVIKYFARQGPQSLCELEIAHNEENYPINPIPLPSAREFVT